MAADCSRPGEKKCKTGLHVETTLLLLLKRIKEKEIKKKDLSALCKIFFSIKPHPLNRGPEEESLMSCTFVLYDLTQWGMLDRKREISWTWLGCLVFPFTNSLILARLR
jgi:hypothetical protein